MKGIDYINATETMSHKTLAVVNNDISHRFFFNLQHFVSYSLSNYPGNKTTPLKITRRQLSPTNNDDERRARA